MVLLFTNAQARSPGSSGSLALPYMNEFIKLSELPLSTAPYSIAPSALADGFWSLICSFFIIIIFIYSGKKKGVFMNDSLSSHY